MRGSELTSYGRVSVICLFSSLWVTLPPDMGVDYKTEAFLPSHCDFFVFGCRISFLVALSPFLSMAIQQSVVILVFLCEQVSSCPTPPSCLLPPPPQAEVEPWLKGRCLSLMGRYERECHCVLLCLHCAIRLPYETFWNKVLFHLEIFLAFWVLYTFLKITSIIWESRFVVFHRYCMV